MNIKYQLAGLSLALTLAAMPVQAAPANMLVYIHPQEYTHSVKLWQYFDDYWFKQGPTVEPLATAMLAEEFGDVAMCRAGSEGKSLVWLKPRMYYNPQMKTYYGEITASAYTSEGVPVATYVGESQKQGFLDVYPQQQIETVYKMAMQNLLGKMRKDQRLKSVAAEGTPNSNAAATCAMVTALPPPAPIDLNYFFKSIH
ncbi:hypothetical protein MTYP_02363 [Methylophilaceae bacterium]|nr:hypothetical protein MTYP_02363 [Methylophilaceae bacterium]